MSLDDSPPRVRRRTEESVTDRRTACNRGRSYRSRIFSAQIWGIPSYSPLLRCFWKTTGSICMTVPARPFLDWYGSSMATWSSSKRMTADSLCRPWSEDSRFRLIHSLSVLWLEFLCYQSQEFLFLMRLPTLISCMISLGRDPREKTSPTPRSTSVLLLLCTYF
jgi:hypothetical protein